MQAAVTGGFENRFGLKIAGPLDKLSDLDAADLSRHRSGYRLSDGEAGTGC